MALFRVGFFLFITIIKEMVKQDGSLPFRSGAPISLRASIRNTKNDRVTKSTGRRFVPKSKYNQATRSTHSHLISSSNNPTNLQKIMSSRTKPFSQDSAGGSENTEVCVDATVYAQVEWARIMHMPFVDIEKVDAVVRHEIEGWIGSVDQVKKNASQGRASGLDEPNTNVLNTNRPNTGAKSLQFYIIKTVIDHFRINPTEITPSVLSLNSLDPSTSSQSLWCVLWKHVWQILALSGADSFHNFVLFATAFANEPGFACHGNYIDAVHGLVPWSNFQYVSSLTRPNDLPASSAWGLRGSVLAERVPPNKPLHRFDRLVHNMNFKSFGQLLNSQPFKHIVLLNLSYSQLSQADYIGLTSLASLVGLDVTGCRFVNQNVLNSWILALKTKTECFECLKSSCGHVKSCWPNLRILVLANNPGLGPKTVAKLFSETTSLTYIEVDCNYFVGLEKQYDPKHKLGQLPVELPDKTVWSSFDQIELQIWQVERQLIEKWFIFTSLNPKAVELEFPKELKNLAEIAIVTSTCIKHYLSDQSISKPEDYVISLIGFVLETSSTQYRGVDPTLATFYDKAPPFCKFLMTLGLGITKDGFSRATQLQSLAQAHGVTSKERSLVETLKKRVKNKSRAWKQGPRTVGTTFTELGRMYKYLKITVKEVNRLKRKVVTADLMLNPFHGVDVLKEKHIVEEFEMTKMGKDQRGKYFFIILRSAAWVYCHIVIMIIRTL